MAFRIRCIMLILEKIKNEPQIFLSRIGFSAEGLAYDFSYQVTNLGTDRDISEITDGKSGFYKTLQDFSMTSLALNTAFGAAIGLGVIGHQWLSTRVDGGKQIYKLNTIDAPYPSVVVISM
ncbi:MAG: hypothetical protein RSC65_04260, partial [Malacoplasma sp.]